jgi:hypothetical protein
MATRHKTAWIYSPVKEPLFQDIRNHENGLSTTLARVVWQSHKIYSTMPYEQFCSQFYALRRRAQDKALKAKAEEKLLDHGLQNNIYKSTKQPDGAEPYWDGSKAQQLLMEDLKCQEKYHMEP